MESLAERRWPGNLPETLVCRTINLERLSRVISGRQLDFTAEKPDNVTFAKILLALLFWLIQRRRSRMVFSNHGISPAWAHKAHNTWSSSGAAEMNWSSAKQRERLLAVLQEKIGRPATFASLRDWG
jgi:hypothetical protein